MLDAGWSLVKLFPYFKASTLCLVALKQNFYKFHPNNIFSKQNFLKFKSLFYEDQGKILAS